VRIETRWRATCSAKQQQKTKPYEGKRKNKTLTLVTCS
jgi:hypothetical protein